MKTLTQFIDENKIRMGAVEWADRNPNNPEWRDATHYKVTLKCGRRSFTTYFSMGYAHTEEPKIEDVLDCLASDVSSYINTRSFEEWCSEYGYDTDSRKAERIYNVIGRQKDRMQKWLGRYELLETLAFKTERL